MSKIVRFHFVSKDVVDIPMSDEDAKQFMKSTHANASRGWFLVNECSMLINSANVEFIVLEDT